MHLRHRNAERRDNSQDDAVARERLSDCRRALTWPRLLHLNEDTRSTRDLLKPAPARRTLSKLSQRILSLGFCACTACSVLFLR